MLPARGEQPSLLPSAIPRCRTRACTDLPSIDQALGSWAPLAIIMSMCMQTYGSAVSRTRAGAMHSSMPAGAAAQRLQLPSCLGGCTYTAPSPNPHPPHPRTGHAGACDVTATSSAQCLGRWIERHDMCACVALPTRIRTPTCRRTIAAAADGTPVTRRGRARWEVVAIGFTVSSLPGTPALRAKANARCARCRRCRGHTRRVATGSSGLSW